MIIAFLIPSLMVVIAGYILEFKFEDSDMANLFYLIAIGLGLTALYFIING